MKFFLSGLGNMYANHGHIKKAVIEADGLGFDGALMPDHYMWGSMGGGGTWSKIPTQLLTHG